MDLSEEYRLMCTKAEEIQALKESGMIMLTDRDYIDGENTWLPTQDQLQLLVIKKMQMLNIIFKDGVIICNLYNPKQIQPWPSFEQLWLVLVMLLNFKKYWDYKEHEWKEAKPKSNLILPN